MQIYNATDKYTPYGGLIIIEQLFKSKGISSLINTTLGSRGLYSKFTFSDILQSIICSQLSNGSAIEDIHELKKKNLEASFSICSADTALNTLKQLAIPNEAHITQDGSSVMLINHHPTLNNLLFTMAIKTKLLVPNVGYCVDMDTTILPNDKEDANFAYNKQKGYNPLLAAVGSIPIYIEGRSGNTSPAYGLLDALKKIHQNFKDNNLILAQIRIDSAGYQSDIIDYCNDNGITFYIRTKSSRALEDAIADATKWLPVKDCILKTEVATTYLEINKNGTLQTVIVSRRSNKKTKNTLLEQESSYIYYSIITNDTVQTEEAIYQFYNSRGAFEQNNSSLKNEFNWKNLPCSYLHQNTVFMLVAAIGKLLFEYLKKHIHQYLPNLITNTGIELKSFINKFVSVVAKWTKHSRKRILKIFSPIQYHLLLE